MIHRMKAMRVLRGVSQFLCMVMLLLSGSVSAQNEGQRMRSFVNTSPPT